MSLLVEVTPEFVCPPLRTFYGRLDLHPVPASRPRVTTNGTYTPKEYRQFKRALASLLKSKRIPRHDWHHLDVTFWLPYPKRTAKRDLIHGGRHRKKPDGDNFLKGMMDALTDAGILTDDGQLSDPLPRKRYCLAAQGYITFRLLAYA